MRLNLPVTDVEYAIESDRAIVSTTDLQGNITYANPYFIEVSGFEKEDLIGAPQCGVIERMAAKSATLTKRYTELAERMLTSAEGKATMAKVLAARQQYVDSRKRALDLLLAGERASPRRVAPAALASDFGRL